MPDISVVIATRERAASLARLLRCVRSQQHVAFECIVVDDASSEKTRESYGRLWMELDARFRLLVCNDDCLPKGPSATRNRGIGAAVAPYIAFCDDDDQWLRTDHLQIAVDSLRRNNADMFFANMQTSRDGTVIGVDFYSTIRPFLTRASIPCGCDVFEIPMRQRVRAMKHMFLHCDSLVVSSVLLKKCGGFWEKLSMAEDRDFTLRLLDRAEKVLYRDVVVAEYDRTAQIGLCNSYSEDEIRQFVVLAMLRAESQLENPAMRAVARGYRAWMMLELAHSANSAGQVAQCRELVMQSLVLRPTLNAARLFLKTTALRSAQECVAVAREAELH